MRAIPERPARMFAHAAPTPTPTGETIPSPVTTTRRGIRLERDGCDGLRRARNAILDRDRQRLGRPTRAARRPTLELSALLLHVRADEFDCLFDRGDLFRF